MNYISVDSSSDSLQAKCAAGIQPCFETGFSDLIVNGRNLLLASSLLII
jgi:hypothetical protein